MLFGCDVFLEIAIGRKDPDLIAEASAVDEVDDANMNLLQFLARPFSDESSRLVRTLMIYLPALSD